MGFSAFARRYLRNNFCFIFLLVLKCFTSQGLHPSLALGMICKQIRFPHSEISGSKVARHLPEAYRRHATSFIASFESRHPPCALTFLIRKCIYTAVYCTFFRTFISPNSYFFLTFFLFPDVRPWWSTGSSILYSSFLEQNRDLTFLLELAF